MKNHWRTLLALLPENKQREYYHNFFKKEHIRWENSGKPLPVSNFLKQQTLKEFGNKYNIKTFVETGTYFGDTLYAVAPNFNVLYSIELSKHFYAKAKKRFDKLTNVHLLQGDSGEVLKDLLPKLKEPAIFWLDGHYSGGLTAKGNKECPVFEELKSIFASAFQHLIFIDDARLFIGQNDYPTITELKNFVQTSAPAYSLSIQNDCIRLLPDGIQNL